MTQPAARTPGVSTPGVSASAVTWLTELARAEEAWRLTFENSPLGMAIVSPEGHFVHVNEALSRITGYPAVILRELTFEQITHPDDLAADVGLVVQCLAGTISSYRLPKRYLHADGHEVPVEISVALVRDRDGDPLHFVVHIEDVTERMRARAETDALVLELAQRSSDLQRSNEDLAHFASVASHDLRTPLTAIAGYLELLDDQPLQAQSRALLSKARSAADRMQSLLDSMLSHARADGAAVVTEPIGIASLTRDVAAELGIAPHVVHLEIDPAPLVADHGLVRQILTNLLGNAVKYRHPERPLTILVRQGARTPQGVVLSVADNGSGIPDELLDRVFDMYVRDGSRRVDSHGIGLATCRRIMERHGGRIWAEPHLLGGAAIYCRFPV